MNNNILKLKFDDDLIVEFDCLYKNANGNLFKIDPRRVEILKRIAELDEIIGECEDKIGELDKEIDGLTCKADNLDYLLAVASGALTGMIDVFFVGEMNLKEAKGKANERVNKFIEWYAKCCGYDKKDGGLKGAISFLENKFPVSQDNSWSGAGINVGTKNHHLADLAHHPTLVGLLAAIIVQFFRVGIFVDRNGEWHFTPIETEPEELLKIWTPVFISGFLLWLTNVAKQKYEDNIGKELPKPLAKLIKLLAAAPVVLEVLSVTTNWLGHLVSDMGGSKNTPGQGMGIPGFFISLLHELASIPPLNMTSLPQKVNDLYTKEKIDFRMEVAVIGELGKQAIPVIINEIIVRAFYFIRRMIRALGDYKTWDEVEWNKINWDDVIPFKNRTITRMITIASGTFTVIDMMDAGIRAAISSKGNMAVFWSKFLLRINFVGVGRFTVALATDLYMGYERKVLVGERMAKRNYLMVATDTKMWYVDYNMWISAQEAGQALMQCYHMMQQFCISYTSLVHQYELTDKHIIEILERKKGRIARYKIFWDKENVL